MVQERRSDVYRVSLKERQYYTKGEMQKRSRRNVKTVKPLVDESTLGLMEKAHNKGKLTD